MNRLLHLLPTLLVGTASVAIYLAAFKLPFPLEQWWQHAQLDYAWFTDYELAGQVRFVGAFALLFALHHGLYLRLRRHPREGPLWLVLVGQAALGLSLVWMYPVAAIDEYDYLLYGRMAVYWGANPLVVAPSAFPDEPTLGFSYWPDERSVYGPVWQILSEWVTRAVDGQVYEGLVAFKLVALAAGLGTTVLVWLVVRRLRPELAAAGAVYFGWHPLLQFEGPGNAHNDTLMVLFLAAGVLSLVGSARWLALPALALALLVKITAAPLAPLFALGALLGSGSWRRRLAGFAAGAIVAFALAVATYAPYWQGRASLPFLDRGNWFTASPPTLLRELFRQWQPFETAGSIAATICAGVFGVAVLVLLGALARRHWPSTRPDLPIDLLRTGYAVFFAYLFLACLWWQPWYLLVLALFAATSGERALAERTTLFACGGVLSYVVFKYVWAIYQDDWQLDYLRIMALSVLAIFTLPLAHLAATWLALARRSARPAAT